MSNENTNRGSTWDDDEVFLHTQSPVRLPVLETNPHACKTNPGSPQGTYSHQFYGLLRVNKVAANPGLFQPGSNLG